MGRARGVGRAGGGGTTESDILVPCQPDSAHAAACAAATARAASRPRGSQSPSTPRPVCQGRRCTRTRAGVVPCRTPPEGRGGSILGRLGSTRRTVLTAAGLFLFYCKCDIDILVRVSHLQQRVSSFAIEGVSGARIEQYGRRVSHLQRVSSNRRW